MQHHKFVGTISSVSVLAALITLAGCGGGDEVAKPRKPKTPATGKPDPRPSALVAIEPKEYGVLTGTVTIEGDVPTPAKQKFTGDDAAKCAMGSGDELVEQTWLVDPASKGVRNVVVFLKAPDGKFFKLKPEDRQRKDEVVLDQPHCAFMPHVVALFPKYYDDEKAKDYVPSGQVFKVVNNASGITHNTKITPVDQGLNPQINVTLASGDKKEFMFTPDPSGPMKVVCDFHGWMNGKIWVFDHPYSAVTDKNGKFEIKNVPVGVPVSVVAWHEGAGYFHGGNNGKEMTLKAKEELNLAVKAK